jgi:hypothetical protein
MVELIALAVPIAWVLIAGFLVETEYYDGYDTICNARRLTGRGHLFIANRAPMMMALNAPAELAHAAGGFRAMDASPYHVWMGVLRAAYVLLVWMGLRRLFGRSWPMLMAFAAAVPCFMFFEYAPFISHDILPGVMLLGMLIAAEALRRQWSWAWWTLMIGLGAAAPLTKHIFGLFWVYLVIAHLVLLLVGRGRNHDAAENGGARKDVAPPPVRLLGMLVLGALISGALAWLGIATTLYLVEDRTSFLMLALVQLQFLFSLQGDPGQFPWWVYLRNLPAYGLLTTVLILPAIVVAWRSGGYGLRMSAIMWVTMVVTMHLINYREVRYILFLVPVSAVLLVPIMRYIVADRRRFAVAAVLLIVGLLPGYPYSIVMNMLRITEPFYQRSELATFLELLQQQDGAKRAPVLWYARLLSASPPTARRSSQSRGTPSGDTSPRDRSPCRCCVSTSMASARRTSSEGPAPSASPCRTSQACPPTPSTGRSPSADSLSSGSCRTPDPTPTPSSRHPTYHSADHHSTADPAPDRAGAAGWSRGEEAGRVAADRKTVAGRGRTRVCSLRTDEPVTDRAPGSLP